MIWSEAYDFGIYLEDKDLNNFILLRTLTIRLEIDYIRRFAEQSFINPINIYWMGGYNAWGPILSASDTAVNQTNEVFAIIAYMA